MSDETVVKEDVKKINEYKNIHRYSKNNKIILGKNKNCVCFHCLNTFMCKDVREWADNETTAICPGCNVDSVIPKTKEVTEDFLKGMHEYWFSPIFK